MLVIALVRHLELPEGDIADCGIKKAVGKICILEALHCNAVFLIQLLRDSSGNAVQLHTVELRTIHAFGNKPHKIANAAGGLQHIAGLKAHVLQCAVHRLDYHGWRIEGRQRGFSCRRIFLIGKHILQLAIMGIFLLEEFREPAPAHIIGKHTLLCGCCQPVFRIQLVQELNGTDIVIEPFQRCAHADVVVLNSEVSSVLGVDLRVQHMRHDPGRLFHLRRRSERFFLVIQQGLRIGIGHNLAVFDCADGQSIQFLVGHGLRLLHILIRLRIVCDREFFHDLQQPVIQRIFFEPVIELFTSQLLVKQRELRIKEDDLLLVKRQQLVFLCADIDCIAEMIAVFLPGLRRRVQLIKGRLKGLCHIAVQRFQHGFAPCGQVGVVRNDRIHCFAHHGEDEVTLRSTGVHFLFAHAERTPAA